jgi:tetratricopeptide (TPR) repeat protein
MGFAYEKLREIPMAVEHFEQMVTLGRKQGTYPEGIEYIERKLQRLKATLTPAFVEATMPKHYNPEALNVALQERLDEDELETLVNPLASSPEMKRWAEELVEGATNELDKAKALFDGLNRRIQLAGKHRARTAREVFAAWNDPEDFFVCQEYAKLFVALARDVGVRSSFVHVHNDYRGKVVTHACAAVFADEKALLIDPTYHWFGVPHVDFVILDDLEAIASHYFQPSGHPKEVVARARLARKLDPKSVWGRLGWVAALLGDEQWDVAREELNEVLTGGPVGWHGYLLQGVLAANDGETEDALGFLRQAQAANLAPEDAYAHHKLGAALLLVGKLAEARKEFRAVLRYRPDPGTAASARRAIVQINEFLGGNDLEESDVLESLRRAAEQGNTHAQTALWEMYFKGERVKQDYSEALKWLLRAAEQGHAKAQYNLALAYHAGQGMHKDLIEAYAWANVDSNRQPGTSKLLGDLMFEMTDAQLEKGKARVIELREQIGATQTEATGRNAD